MYVLTFIYKEKRGIMGVVYKQVMKYILHGIYIDKLIVFSENEIEYYANIFNLKEDKFIFLPLSMATLPEQPVITEMQSRRYVLSVGRSNRNYEFLIDALNNEKYEVEIICDVLKKKSLPKNIHIHNDIFYSDMLKWMYNCYCVVIPLKDLNISSGQLVLLQAMQMKKPIIITNSKGVQNYIINEYNGLVINNAKDELLKSLNRIYSDKDFYKYLISNGYKEWETKYSTEVFVCNLVHCIM